MNTSLDKARAKAQAQRDLQNVRAFKQLFGNRYALDSRMPWITVFSAVEKDSIVGELKSAGVRFTVTEKSYPAQTVAGNNMPAVSMWSVKAEGGK